jgi:hypothetical protein
MQNIDPVFMLQPIIIIVIATALFLYWHVKRHFHLMVLVYSLVAYAVAIALKYVVQIPTAAPVIGYFGPHSIGLGVYLGLQTVFFEVGLAYIVACFAVSRDKLDKKDSEAYGSGLALWENAGFLGALSLINLFAVYSILSGNSTIAQTLYDQLKASNPALFAPASEALGLVALGIVERISSILMHFAWGYLCLMAAVTHKKRLFLIALPMGFVDFLVPFFQASIVLFEAVVLVLAILSVLVAWFSARSVLREKPETNNQVTDRQPEPSRDARNVDFSRS